MESTREEAVPGREFAMALEAASTSVADWSKTSKEGLEKAESEDKLAECRAAFVRSEDAVLEVQRVTGA